MKRAKFKVRQSPKNKKWYWKLVAGNGETIATSEPYKTKQSAMRGITSVRFNAPFAKVVVQQKKK